MWDDEKQQRLDELRQRAAREPLLPEEQATLEALLAELDQVEWAALQPALAQQQQEYSSLRAEAQRVEAQNADLTALTERYADLITRARAQLASLRHEHKLLQADYERLLG